MKIGRGGGEKEGENTKGDKKNLMIRKEREQENKNIKRKALI